MTVNRIYPSFKIYTFYLFVRYTREEFSNILQSVLYI